MLRRAHIAVIVLGYLAWLLHWYQLVSQTELLNGNNQFLPATGCYGALTLIHAIGVSGFDVVGFLLYTIGIGAMISALFLRVVCGIALNSMYIALPFGVACACIIGDVTFTIASFTKK